jgi:hypothetical protein
MAPIAATTVHMHIYICIHALGIMELSKGSVASSCQSEDADRSLHQVHTHATMACLLKQHVRCHVDAETCTEGDCVGR